MFGLVSRNTTTVCIILFGLSLLILFKKEENLKDAKNVKNILFQRLSEGEDFVVMFVEHLEGEK